MDMTRLLIVQQAATPPIPPTPCTYLGRGSQQQTWQPPMVTATHVNVYTTTGNKGGEGGCTVND